MLYPVPLSLKPIGNLLVSLSINLVTSNKLGLLVSLRRYRLLKMLLTEFSIGWLAVRHPINSLTDEYFGISYKNVYAYKT